MNASDLNRKVCDYFDSVIQGYIELQEYQPLVACNYDEFQPTKKRTPQVSEFLADVILATKRVLKTPELFRAWERMLREEPVPLGTAEFIRVRCGALYRSRQLAPPNTSLGFVDGPGKPHENQGTQPHSALEQ